MAICKASSTISSPNLEKNNMNFDNYSMTASEFLRVPSTPYLASFYRYFINFRLDILNKKCDEIIDVVNNIRQYCEHLTQEN
jgi:hypothetical protein